MECGQKYFQEALVCPACETSLTQRDDVVITNLNPTEDYKSSVLSGLRPELIAEIASRALSFWVTSQEAAYQEIVRKGLNDKCADLERKVQQVIRDANQELGGLLKEREMERRRHHELSEQFAEKSRQFQKLQSMYDKLKRKSPISLKDSEGFRNVERNSITRDKPFAFSQKKNDHPLFSQKSRASNFSQSPARQQFNDRNSTPNPLQNRRFNLFKDSSSSISFDKPKKF
ncbi:hypothetical protein HDV01_000032 [Terramyces sp. JEL0728]|nr:hypothetical protein HDV01_000032 [Terramyces sp. JEL0728]